MVITAMTKKIERLTVNKRDEAAVVVEKIIDSEAHELVLSIPRFSKLADSLANFHLIKREADLLKKKVIIESVDDKAIELAGLAKLESVNPFFVKSRRQFSDIVVNQPKKIAVAVPLKEEKLDRKKTEWSLPKLPSLGKTVIILGLAVILLILLFIVIKVLPRAEIAIISKKTPWSFNDSVIVDKAVADIDYLKSKIPGQLFSQTRNLQLVFPASGKKKVEKYAGGTITVYNSYSSEPQPLVVRTRFLAPDGKIFRLTKGITVPGAKIVEGKIIPSSIEAAVIADQPGEAYNIGPVSRFSIPGLKGTPKYEAFYAESKAEMTGGFIGEAGYPTDDDFKKAKAELRQKLEEALSVVVISQIPGEFKVLEGAKEISFGAPEITEADRSGNFGIFGEAKMAVLTFKESDVSEMFLRKVRGELGLTFKLKDQEMEYGQPRADFKKGAMSFPIKFNGVAVQLIDTDELKQKLVGQSEQDLKAIIFGLSGLESAKISLWPFWVQKVPKNPDKITVAVD